VGVPFVDLNAQYRAIRSEIGPALQEVIDSASFVLGPAVERFEREFADYLGVESVVATNSGTAALQLTLLALAVGAGDEVIVPAHTFIATAEAVSHVGAKPVFVDVFDDTGNLDPTLLPAAFTAKTRAIIPVHLYGQPADLDQIVEFARPKGLFVIEDACQAHGATYGGRHVGSFGTAACFSFYPGKNLGAYGEGGAVATRDSVLAERIRRLRDHGQSERYRHVEVGYNARMDGIQGAVLSVKLRHLDRWNEARRAHAANYSRGLTECGIRLPIVRSGREAVFHLYVVRSEKRDTLRRHLADRGVQTGLHYPIPLHLQPAYFHLGHQRGDFPESERWADSGLSLPMYSELTQAQRDEVIEAVLSFQSARVRP